MERTLLIIIILILLLAVIRKVNKISQVLVKIKRMCNGKMKRIKKEMKLMMNYNNKIPKIKIKLIKTLTSLMQAAVAGVPAAKE